MKNLHLDNTLLTDKEFELPEPLKIKKFTFTLDPIPEEYLFPKWDEFIVPLPIEGYPNRLYVKENIVPNLVKVYNELTPYIYQLSDIINQVQKIVKDSSVKRYKKMFKTRPHFLNVDIYRKFGILLPIFIEIRTSLNAIRLSILQDRLTTLVKLQKLCRYLAEHPRYVHVKSQTATQNWRGLEFDYMPEVFSRYIAYRNQLDDLIILLEFIPKPFAEEKANKTLIMNLLRAHLGIRDPVTGYIPYIEEFETLASFLESKVSPFNLKYIKTLNQHQLNNTLSRMHQAIADWLGVHAGKRSMNEVIKSVIGRLLFDRYYSCLRPLGLASEALNQHIVELSVLPLSKLGITDQVCKVEYLSMTPSQFFASNDSDLNQVIDNLTMCLFCTNPIDAAWNIYKANMAIASHLARMQNSDVTRSQKFDDLFKIWRIAFIAAQIPEPDQLLEWLSMYLSLEVMPPMLASACKIPQMVINTLLTEALTMKN